MVSLFGIFHYKNETFLASDFLGIDYSCIVRYAGQGYSAHIMAGDAGV